MQMPENPRLVVPPALSMSTPFDRDLTAMAGRFP
jgi:hypothetical protein